MKTDRIRSLSKEKGISLSFICRKLGVANVYFIDIDKSGRDIPNDKLSVIAKILETSPEYLAGKTDDPSSLSKQCIDHVIQSVSKAISTNQEKEKMLDAVLKDVEHRMQYMELMELIEKVPKEKMEVVKAMLKALANE